ncbi:DUF3630 family protein [Parasalinivibrio latis]|uniref:DUF3630 family protein n=1 Tax=Parasalinivibrio latis TaxID=2952610 RepID=UPI0030E0CC95
MSFSFSSLEFKPDEGRLVLTIPELDFDNAPALMAGFLSVIGAHATEAQTDADLHSWLVDFEGCRLMLRAEHYSTSMWLETLDGTGQEELAFLAGWLGKR